MLRIRGLDIDTAPFGLLSVSFNEPGGPPRITDFDPRKRTPRALVFHTTSGGARKVATEAPSGGEDTYAQYQVKTDRFVSWDGTIGKRGRTLWQNDPAEWYSWHATAWNSCSMGVEIVEARGTIYQAQLDAAVLLADVVTALFGIQRQIPWDAVRGGVQSGVLPRADEKGKDKGASLVGIFAHFHNTLNRGAGDPGRFVFDALKQAGYEGFDMRGDEDQRVWKDRQKSLGIVADGLPLRDTQRALRASGKLCGMWVPRPCDAALDAISVP
jgi:hypothetical protein